MFIPQHFCRKLNLPSKLKFHNNQTIQNVSMWMLQYYDLSERLFSHSLSFCLALVCRLSEYLMGCLLLFYQACHAATRWTRRLPGSMHYLTNRSSTGSSYSSTLIKYVSPPHICMYDIHIKPPGPNGNRGN